MFNSIWDQITTILGGFVPSLLGAIALLIVGWLIARGVSSLVGAALRRTRVDQKIAASMTEGSSTFPVESTVSRLVFWLMMVMVFIGVLQVLGLTLAAGPLDELVSTVLEYVPRLVAAGVLLVVAWLVATILRLLVSKALTTAGLDRRLSGPEPEASGRQYPVARSVADGVYWLVFLFFLPAILNSLALEGLLNPVQGMITEILAFLPNLFVAALVFVVGWFLARIIQRIVKSLAVAFGADRLADRVGMAGALGTTGLSGLLGTVAYVLFLIPVLITALAALNLDPLTEPASNMLNMVLTAIPSIFAAIVLMAIAYIVGRAVARLVTALLAGGGFDSLVAKLTSQAAGSASPNAKKGSDIVGTLILVAIMLISGIEALRLIHFDAVADLVSEFLQFSGHVALGLVIFAVGLFLANLAARTIRESKTSQAVVLATAARASILILAAAIGLREMGVGADIVRLAFALLVGAVAVATAVAFGIGGRTLAQEKLERWSKDVDSHGTQN